MIPLRSRGTPLRPAALLLLLLSPLATGCQGLAHWATTPGGEFGSRAAPPRPDYADPESWAALPGTPSRADAVPPGSGAAVPADEAVADAFFVHPTTYFWRHHWNAPVGGWLTGTITNAALAGQASAFNAVARIYAPRYRQMTLSGFDDSATREPGLELAYEDVRAAFLHYLDAWAEDRPLVLAGHSQGSRMLLRLLDEFFRSGPLRERLVAAYVVGTPVWSGPFRRGEAAISVCENAVQTGCLVTWRTFAEGAAPSLDANPGETPDGESLCVNPLSWSPGGSAPASENLGSIPLPMVRGPARPRPELTGARCGEGVLWITPPSGHGFRLAHGDGNWHAYDYALFYSNVRANAVQRVATFLEGDSAPD